MGAGYTRQELHRERGDAGFRHRLNRVLMAVRVDRRDEERAGLEMRDFLRIRPSHFQHQIGAERFFRGNKPRAGGLIVPVEEARLAARATLNGNVRPQADEFLDRFRGRRDARFSRVGFRGRSDQHGKTFRQRAPNAASWAGLELERPQERGGPSRGVATALEHWPLRRNASKVER